MLFQGPPPDILHIKEENIQPGERPHLTPPAPNILYIYTVHTYCRYILYILHIYTVHIVCVCVYILHIHKIYTYIFNFVFSPLRQKTVSP